MIRAIIQSVYEGVIKRFTASGRADEVFTSREYFQHYGFTSRPIAGAEAILIKDGNHIVMIASDDRRYRLAIEDGEVAIYTDEGDHILFKRGKEIYIKSGNKLKADIENDVEVNTKNAVVNASVKATVVSPEINLGDATRANLKRMIDERFRALFNGHVHSGCGGSVNSGTPTQTLELAAHCTDITRAK